MYLTMYLSKKIYFMALSDRGRETERPCDNTQIFNLSISVIYLS
jgi:hypothetical protein